jgi:hypothetical protein
VKFIFSSILILFLTACVTLDRTQTGLKREIRDESHLTQKGDSAPKKRLMVLPFLDVSEKRPQDFRDRAREAFIYDLNRSGEVIALDSHDLKIDLSRMMEGGHYKLPEIVKAAQALGFSAVLEGKINDIRIKRKSDQVGIVRQLSTVFEVEAQTRVVMTRTAQEVFNTIKTVTVEDQGVRVAERMETDRFFQSNPQMIEVIVKDTFFDFTPQVLASLDKVAWEGRIAAINGSRLYLNVGKVSGLQVGDLLKVMDDGDDVYDPENGSHIGRVPGRLKGTLELISYFGADGSIAVIHSGSGFKENDRVELY